ncbi:hypothetical protein RchiOBHm_Chr2g0152821 [Rosa chinensis]|uniref:Uncharacterized protein n=1 Tax=Rosa chinensis TaxID=74649 RepID=A0A2P6S0I2_ROSCH|nr:hypothetical protein RchiOBHm_Chr2g0152821 [Rosa chinensis]
MGNQDLNSNIGAVDLGLKKKLSKLGLRSFLGLWSVRLFFGGRYGGLRFGI